MGQLISVHGSSGGEELFLFRAISYTTGSSASAFAVTLSAFLAGLASGSLLAGRSCRRAPRAAMRTALGALMGPE